MRRLAALVALLWLMATPPVLAQDDQATLVADRLFINADTTLTAEGAVEIFFKGTHLKAARLTYDRATDRLVIDGPITMTDEGGTVILASSADLSRDMSDGILKSARMVMQDQLQLAADELRRASGRYTTLDRVVASSCQVCPAHPVPLWEIRARRVLHDQKEHQLYFQGAQFRVGGVPLLYIPRLRMPDPSLKRATGVLMPSFRSSSTLGLGVRLPYFIAIDDSRDLTVTPYLSEGGQGMLMLRYRQAFRTGRIEFNGALGRDKLQPGQERGYLFGTGTFALPDDYSLGFQIETVSDEAYLLDYGISDKDRLSSGVWVTRTRRDQYFDGRILNYDSLRTGDDNQVLPTLVGDLTYIHRMTPEVLGGQAALRLDYHGLNRRSTTAIDANGDGVTDGRDVARASIGVDWHRQSILANGMVLGFSAALDAHFYSIAEDLAYPGTVTRLTPAFAVDLAWPWVKPAAGGHSAQVLEPVAQLVWSDPSADPVPNEDSALVEFDEGNLFSFSRAPGADLYESGLRANLGVKWSRFDPDGWRYTIAAGRVLRSENLAQFSTGTSLAGTRSDWLLALQLATDDGLYVTNRALFDDQFDFSKNELRLDMNRNRYDLGASYVWLTADPVAGRLVPTNELAFDAGWQIGDGWRGTAMGRYDFTADRAARAGVGVEYRSECAAVDLSLSRRFTSSTSVKPTTEISLSVSLSGVGTGSDGRSYRKSCSY